MNDRTPTSETGNVVCPKCGEKHWGYGCPRDFKPGTKPTVSSKEMDFGDYCLIEQKRYGVPNEMYVHKVIGRLESNAWVNVPVDAANGGLTERNHEDVVPVVAAICCGVVEREVRKYRASDCIARPTNETPEQRCGWFGEGRGQCLLSAGHEAHLQTRHHTCEQDGRLLDVALTGLAAVREAERRSEKANSCVCGEPNSPGTHRTDGPCLAPIGDHHP